MDTLTPDNDEAKIPEPRGGQSSAPSCIYFSTTSFPKPFSQQYIETATATKDKPVVLCERCELENCGHEVAIITINRPDRLNCFNEDGTCANYTQLFSD
mmetsp:Transcript_11143/g.13613  ORF Transcript_11143/g.13613 Transcript_11143/m.13613 type:complete len:99 (+) Transcript_11143:76-372(+)